MPPVNAEIQAAAFLASEPSYTKAGWIDAYAMAMGRMRPKLSPAEASALAVHAYEREGWNNPKVAAMLDAMLGPLEPQPARS